MNDNPEQSSLEDYDALDDDEYKANLSLVYDYMEKSIKEIQDSSDNVNNKFLLLATFNITYVRFFLASLPEINNYINHLPCNSCLYFKISSYVFSILSIIGCFVGLYQSSQYFIISPDRLVPECNLSTISGLRLAIIETRATKLENFIELAGRKKKIFNHAMILLAVSGLFATLDILIDLMFNHTS